MRPDHAAAGVPGPDHHEEEQVAGVDTAFKLPVPNGNPACQFGPPGPAQDQVSAARWIASRKLPNRRRIVFSDGRMAASVQLSAVGIEPCSATNLRRAATASAIRVLAMSGSGTASPSNTQGGFVWWEGPPNFEFIYEGAELVKPLFQVRKR